MPRLSHAQMADMIARDLPARAAVNLGIGLPTTITDHISPDKQVMLHSENGILGMQLLPPGAPADPDLINASKQPVALAEGAAIFDHVVSFSMMRGGHLDVSVMGAFEVAANGDLANWSRTHDDLLPSVGGAMDLAVGARRVWIMMDAQTRDGRPRLVSRCALPLTGMGMVDRVYSDIGVFDVADGAFVVREPAPGWTFERLREVVAGPLRAIDAMERAQA